MVNPLKAVHLVLMVTESDINLVFHTARIEIKGDDGLHALSIILPVVGLYRQRIISCAGLSGEYRVGIIV